jgi:3-hydroxyacyl-[acyl-carrier-protein] dehydratase
MAEIVIPQQHPCFPGHFPGQPILPGVLVLERVLALVEQQSGKAAARYKLRNIKFLSAVEPGDHLVIDLVNVDGQGSNFSVHAMSSDHSHRRLACSGQLRWGESG